MLVGERAPGAGEIGRRVVERGPFLLRLRLAFGEFGDAALRLGKPLAPGRALGGDRAAPRGARLRFARDRLRRRARFGESGALARRSLARLVESLPDGLARPKLIKRGLGVCPALRGFVARGAGAGEGLLDRGQARQRLGALALELSESVASRVGG